MTVQELAQEWLKRYDDGEIELSPDDVAWLTRKARPEPEKIKEVPDKDKP